MGIIHGLYLVVCALLLYISLLVVQYLLSRNDPREPPVVQPNFPILGHIFGLFVHGVRYFEQLGVKHRLPIYTLQIFTIKMVIVTSIPLVSALQRNAKTIKFDPFVKMAGRRLSGIDPGEMHAFDASEKGVGLARDTIGVVERALGPGPEATRLTQDMLGHLQALLAEHGSSLKQPMYLFSWIRHIITQASTRAAYGDFNPLTEKIVEDGFWDFEDNAAPLLLGFAPSWIARKAVKAREGVADKFVTYFQNSHHLKGSYLARIRHESGSHYGLSPRGMARLEVAFLIGVLANTVPTTFWSLCHIYSRPSLLAALRAELTRTVTTTKISGKTIHTIDMALIKQRCPLLLSTYHEILRSYCALPSSRIVLEDCTVDQYVLKKGTIVQIPAISLHRDPKNWGPDVAEMNFERFLSCEDSIKGNTAAESGMKDSRAFRAFGAAPNICPGRHFATTEILGAVASIVMRYEVVPVAKGTKSAANWQIPSDNPSVFAAVSPPLVDVEVQFLRRDDVEAGEWRFEMGSDKVKFALASG